MMHVNGPVDGRNSFDVLRLGAALMVFYSHQNALLGLPEPSFLPWNTFGDAGVAIFFFLSGLLVWTSWVRDPNVKRFFLRRSLRVFPALWVLCLVSVFLLGPLLTTLSLRSYFGSPDSWRYLGTALLVSSRTLPGLFPENAVPFAVNGSLWTLPVEYLCYGTVAVVGMVMTVWRSSGSFLLFASVLAAISLASYGSILTGHHFVPHLEMVALFWFGAFYGYILSAPQKNLGYALAAIALVLFAVLGHRGMERTTMLIFVVSIVHLARNMVIGARLTESVGDLSYGAYIYAFPIQQALSQYGKERGWNFQTCLSISVALTIAVAHLSWQCVEKRALRLKPSVPTAEGVS